MNPLGNPNPKGTLITVPQAAYESNLSIKTTRKLAKEAGAFVKIGGSSRVIGEKFFSYICNTYAE